MQNVNQIIENAAQEYVNTIESKLGGIKDHTDNFGDIMSLTKQAFIDGALVQSFIATSDCDIFKIDFEKGEIDQDENGAVMGYTASMPRFKLLVTGKTKEEALKEVLTSIKVLLAYHNSIKI